MRYILHGFGVFIGLMVVVMIKVNEYFEGKGTPFDDAVHATIQKHTQEDDNDTSDDYI